MNYLDSTIKVREIHIWVPIVKYMRSVVTVFLCFAWTICRRHHPIHSSRDIPLRSLTSSPVEWENFLSSAALSTANETTCVSKFAIGEKARLHVQKAARFARINLYKIPNLHFWYFYFLFTLLKLRYKLSCVDVSTPPMWKGRLYVPYLVFSGLTQVELWW